MSISYRLLLSPDDNGTLLVTCPALPEVTSFGETALDAYARGAQAVEEAIAARIATGGDLPTVDGARIDLGPGEQVLFYRLPLQTELKGDLYNALRASGISRAELARRLGWGRTSVDRLFMLDHASRIDQLEAAAQAFGLDIEVRMVERDAA